MPPPARPTIRPTVPASREFRRGFAFAVRPPSAARTGARVGLPTSPVAPRIRGLPEACRASQRQLLSVSLPWFTAKKGYGNDTVTGPARKQRWRPLALLVETCSTMNDKPLL